MTPATFVSLALAGLSLLAGCTSKEVPARTGGASAEQLEAACRADGVACAATFANWGLTPPRGTSDVPPSCGLLELRLSPIALSVDRADVFPLTAGRPAPGVFADHVSPALLDVLAGWDRITSEPCLAVLADRATPLSTLADALFTATRAGFTDFELIVHDGERLRGVPLSPPLEWSPPDPDRKLERPLELVFVVTADAVEVRVAGTHAGRFARGDLTALDARVDQLKRAYPNEVVAVFRVDGDLALQALVPVIDAVRGEGCRLAGALRGEAIPRECRFYLAIVDLEPPLRATSRP